MTKEEYPLLAGSKGNLNGRKWGGFGRTAFGRNSLRPDIVPLLTMRPNLSTRLNFFETLKGSRDYCG
jgi:hypothetical protein